jgi:hypothetical protein
MDLARIARDTARESPEPGKKAWVIVAVSLDQARDPAGALDVLSEMVTDPPLRIIAAACLRSLVAGSET